MSRYSVRETFFRPEEYARRQSALPAATYNAFMVLLARSGGTSLFVPIRSMQYQAVVERAEIVFVDGLGGYAYQDGEGGRLIGIAWRPIPAAVRTSLDAPVPCEILYYLPGLEETQRRLASEVSIVLKQLLQRQREQSVQTLERRVLPFRRGS